MDEGHEIEETFAHDAKAEGAASPQPPTPANPWTNTRVPEPPAPESVILDRERRQLGALRTELSREDARLKELRAQLDDEQHALQRRLDREADDRRRREEEQTEAEARERAVFEQELSRQVEDFKVREASFVKKLSLRAQEAEARLEGERIDAETKLVNDLSLRRREAETDLDQKLQHMRLEGEQQAAKLRLDEEQRMSQRLLEAERRAEQLRTQLDETLERRRLEEEARFEQWRREQEQRVLQALEQRRADDEQRLTAALTERRTQEEERLQTWVEERRIAADRVLAQRRADEERRMDAERRAYGQQHERRLIEEEQKLASWRADEERRVNELLSERAMTTEREIQDRRRDEEQRLLVRTEEMLADERRRLAEWRDQEQARMDAQLAAQEEAFEKRLEERRVEEETRIEQRRKDEEARMRGWRAEQESALEERLAARRLEDQRARQRRGAPQGPATDALSRDMLGASSAREVGRVLRDAIAAIVPTNAFSIALHEAQRGEVAYRFRVVSEDKVGEALKSDPLNDAPGSPPTRTREWLRSDREVMVQGTLTPVRVAQRALVDRGRIVGVASLVSENGHLDAAALERVASLVDAAAPRLAELAAAGAYRGAQ